MSDDQDEEYDANITAMLELIWGRGFMAPGGEGNVHRILEGLNLEDKRVLEIGSGLGGGALVMARDYGAHVVGIDVEAPLVEQANKYAEDAGMAGNLEFMVVKPGPLKFEEDSFDIVYSSGVFIHIEDKPALFKEILRLLKPGGILTAYDWLKGPGPLSEDMIEWIRLEELTFYLDTLDHYATMLINSGFENVRTTDASDWYTAEARREYERITGPLLASVTELVGGKKREHFIKDWAAMVKVLESGELRSGYFRATSPL